MKYPTLVAAALLLSACASTSGVQQAGPNTYTITASASHGRGGMPAAKQLVYEAANKECVKQMLQIAVVKENASAPSWTDGMYTVDLLFTCQ